MQAEAKISERKRPLDLVISQPGPLDDDLDELESALGPKRSFTRGQNLFRAGEPCAGIYVIEEGSVKVSAISQNGDEQVVRFCLPGEMLGFEAISEPRYGSSAVALEGVRVRMLSLTGLHALCNRSPRLMDRVFRLVSKRLAELRTHKLILGRQTAAARLATFLTDLRSRMRVEEFQLSMSREAIGSYLGIALETVSRLLRRFENENLIRVSGRRLRLIEPDRLRALAQSGAFH